MDMDYDMPDFGAQQAPEARHQDELDEQEALEAELEAAFDEAGDAQQADAAVGPSNAAGAPPDVVPQPLPPPLALQQPAVAPLPLAADGYVDEEALTREQRNKLDAEKVALMTEEQLDQYEAFRRSSLKRPVALLMSKVLGAKPGEKANIALASVTKTFVGELVEMARLVAEERGEHGPLLPAHVHAAYQRLQRQLKVPTKARRKRLML